MTQYQTKAIVKKFSTQGSKGGSIVVSVEMPLTDENVLLASKQNSTGILTLDFSEQAKDKYEGQHGLDFEGGTPEGGDEGMGDGE